MQSSQSGISEITSTSTYVKNLADKLNNISEESFKLFLEGLCVRIRPLLSLEEYVGKSKLQLNTVMNVSFYDTNYSDTDLGRNAANMFRKSQKITYFPDNIYFQIGFAYALVTKTYNLNKSMSGAMNVTKIKIFTEILEKNLVEIDSALNAEKLKNEFYSLGVKHGEFILKLMEEIGYKQRAEEKIKKRFSTGSGKSFSTTYKPKQALHLLISRYIDRVFNISLQGNITESIPSNNTTELSASQSTATSQRIAISNLLNPASSQNYDLSFFVPASSTQASRNLNSPSNNEESRKRKRK